MQAKIAIGVIQNLLLQSVLQPNSLQAQKSGKPKMTARVLIYLEKAWMYLKKVTARSIKKRAIAERDKL